MIQAHSYSCMEYKVCLLYLRGASKQLAVASNFWLSLSIQTSIREVMTVFPVTYFVRPLVQCEFEDRRQPVVQCVYSKFVDYVGGILLLFHYFYCPIGCKLLPGFWEVQNCTEDLDTIFFWGWGLFSRYQFTRQFIQNR